MMTMLGFLAPHGWLFELAGTFRWQYLLLQVVLGGAFWFGRQRLPALVALLFALVNVAVLMPYYTTAVSAAPPADQPTYRALSLNVGAWNDDHEAVRDLIATAVPDVIVLAEMTETWQQALAPVLTDYPHNNASLAKRFHGTLVYSRLPFAPGGLQRVKPDSRPFVVVELLAGSQTMTLVGVHSISPKSPTRKDVRDHHLAQVAESVANLSGPVLLLGDLNVAAWSPVFETFLQESGLANGRYGFGMQSTWPAQLPLLRVPIDHALTSGGVYITDLTTGPAVGSDHLPLLVDFSLN